jgi:hypothetical protein
LGKVLHQPSREGEQRGGDAAMKKAPIPSDLRKSITLADEMNGWRPEEGKWAEPSRRLAIKASIDEGVRRIDAACQFFDIDPQAPDALYRLLAALLNDRFPSAFEILPKGRKSTTGPTRTWTDAARRAFVARIDVLRAEGKTIPQVEGRNWRQRPRHKSLRPLSLL